MGIYSQFWIHDYGIPPIIVDYETNDDNDDGYPDGDVAKATYHLPTLEKALELTGKSRMGLYGQPVNVYLNGKRI